MLNFSQKHEKPNRVEFESNLPAFSREEERNRIMELSNQITYVSTRGGQSGVTASQAILQGLAKDGGLFMPDQIPKLDRTLEQLSAMSYQETAYEVMKLFLTDYTEEELKACIKKAYDSKFDTEEIAALEQADGAYYLELFHGSTIAFKDMALSILPHLMTCSRNQNYCFLSKRRGKPDPGIADADSKRGKYFGSSHSWKF